MQKPSRLSVNYVYIINIDADNRSTMLQIRPTGDNILQKYTACLAMTYTT